MNYEYICKYCDYKWTTEYKQRSPCCVKCKDTSFTIKKIEKGQGKDVFGYENPQAEEEEEEEEESDSTDRLSQSLRWDSD